MDPLFSLSSLYFSLFTFHVSPSSLPLPVDKRREFPQNGGMETIKAMLPKLVALARWLAFLIVAVASALIAWKIVGIWQGTLGLFPEFDNAIVGVASPWNPFYTYLLTCFLCVLGALPMLRDRRSLGLPRLVIELVYLILSLYLLYAISQVVFASFTQGM